MENLEKIYLNILNFSQRDTPKDVLIAALTYECFRYYNAIEHLMIRILKYLKAKIPSGQFSHRDTLQSFYDIAKEKGFEIDVDTVAVIKELMVFRHVATKIYSFLIDWDKLEVIINSIQKKHADIQQLFINLLDILAT